MGEKLHYVSQNCGKGHLRTFDTKTRRIARCILPVTFYEIPACVSTETLSTCVVDIKGNGSSSDQVLKYDLSVKSVESLTTMKTKRAKSVAIFLQDRLHVLGGYDGSSKLDSVEKYDPDTKEWTALDPMHVKRRGHAVTVLQGKIYVCGGFGINSVEVYDPSTQNWKLLAEMTIRSNFLVVAHEGKLLAIGGDKERTVEIYDPHENKWETEEELSTGLQVRNPKGGLILPDSTPQRAMKRPAQSMGETKNQDVAAKRHKK